MPRPQRNDFAGAWHHVMNRAHKDVVLFADDQDREVFLATLADAMQRFDVEVHGYCLMGNHYHLLLCSSAGQLSPAMQRFASRYTTRVNRRRGADGPVFRGRFASVPISCSGQLLTVSRYIHLNPVTAGLISSVDHWPWSSAAAYLGLANSPVWLETSEILQMFGTADLRRSYREFLVAGVDEATWRRYQEH